MLHILSLTVKIQHSYDSLRESALRHLWRTFHKEDHTIFLDILWTDQWVREAQSQKKTYDNVPPQFSSVSLHHSQKLETWSSLGNRCESSRIWWRQSLQEFIISASWVIRHSELTARSRHRRRAESRGPDLDSSLLITIKRENRIQRSSVSRLSPFVSRPSLWHSWLPYGRRSLRF